MTGPVVYVVVIVVMLDGALKYSVGDVYKDRTHAEAVAKAHRGQPGLVARVLKQELQDQPA